MPPPVITTVPLAGSVVASDRERGPSGSLSLASTSIAVAAASSSTVAASSTATGGSSTQVTVTDTVASEPPLSVYVKRVGAGRSAAAGCIGETAAAAA